MRQETETVDPNTLTERRETSNTTKALTSLASNIDRSHLRVLLDLFDSGPFFAQRQSHQLGVNGELDHHARSDLALCGEQIRLHLLQARLGVLQLGLQLEMGLNEASGQLSRLTTGCIDRDRLHTIGCRGGAVQGDKVNHSLLFHLEQDGLELRVRGKSSELWGHLHELLDVHAGLVVTLLVHRHVVLGNTSGLGVWVRRELHVGVSTAVCHTVRGSRLRQRQRGTQARGRNVSCRRSITNGCRLVYRAGSNRVLSRTLAIIARIYKRTETRKISQTLRWS